MKPLFFYFYCAVFAATGNSLSHTQWVEDTKADCPGGFYFGIKRYLYFNTCYAMGSNGVAERGEYLVSDNVIKLRNRRSTGAEHEEDLRVIGDALQILVLTDTRLVLGAGEKRIHLRRVDPVLPKPTAGEAI